jgi:hypothetical protein
MGKSVAQMVRDAMRKRLLLPPVILVLLMFLAVWLDPTRVLWGWLRGESFYQGRPTSYWSREISRLKPHHGTAEENTVAPLLAPHEFQIWILAHHGTAEENTVAPVATRVAGWDTGVVTQLLNLFRSSEPDTRVLHGDYDLSQIPVLGELLEDRDASVRMYVLQRLWWSLEDYSSHDSYLGTDKTGDRWVHEYSPDFARAAIPLMMRAIHDPNPVVCSTAALFLCRDPRVEGQDHELIQALVTGFQSKDRDTRFLVADCLADLGPRAKAAAPALRALLESNPRILDDYTEFAATLKRALKAIDPEAADRAGVP